MRIAHAVRNRQRASAAMINWRHRAGKPVRKWCRMIAKSFRYYRDPHFPFIKEAGSSRRALRLWAEMERRDRDWRASRPKKTLVEIAATLRAAIGSRP